MLGSGHHHTSPRSIQVWEADREVVQQHAPPTAEAAISPLVCHDSTLVLFDQVCSMRGPHPVQVWEVDRKMLQQHALPTVEAYGYTTETLLRALDMDEFLPGPVGAPAKLLGGPRVSRRAIRAGRYYLATYCKRHVAAAMSCSQLGDVLCPSHCVVRTGN